MGGVFIDTRRTKEGDKKLGIICLTFGFIVLALTYILPSNILDDIPLFKNFVNVLAGIFPTVANLAKYSEFPQVSQFVYSLEIIFIPILTVIMFYFNNMVLDFDKALETRPLVIIIAGPFVFFGVIICPFFLVPGNPDHTSMLSNIISQSYHVKLIFSICTIILSIASCYSILVIVGYIRGLARYFE